MNFKRVMASMLAGTLIMGITLPAYAGLSGKLTASGSSAILPMAKAAAEQFMDKNPDVSVSISGGGSFTGLKQVAEGAVDIGNSDVPAEGAEYKDLVGTKVAVAPFVIIVNKNNDEVKNLSQDQLIDIFSGKIKNWKEVGGADKKITVIGRSTTSGSRATIKKTVMKSEEFTDSMVIQDSNGAVRKAVSTTAGAIGFVDAAYINDSINVLKYNGVTYSDDAVVAGKYPIWTYEYMYTKGAPKGLAKSYIDYVLSSSFQTNNLERLGFIPMTKMAGKKAATETKAPVAVKPSVVVNGKKLSATPVIQNGRVLVPVRAVFDAIGAKTTYDAKTKTVTATKGKTKVKLQVGSKTGYKNNTKVTLDTPAIIINGQTYVPVRFAAEAFGGKVAWDNTKKIATITIK